MSQAKLREALTGGGSSQKDKGPPVADGVLSVEPESSEAIEWRTRRSVIDSIASCSKFLDEEDDEQQPGDLYGKFTWKIDKFSELNKRELRSATFEVGSYKWYILVYPQGCDVANHLSLFLCVADYDKLLPGWAHFAQFTIAVVNKDPKKSKYSDTLHRFCKKEHDWGWKKFMELSKVMEGFTPQDSLVIKAQVQIIRDRPTHPFKCLDAQYRRELVRVYLTNVEGICRRFMEERKESLRRLLNDGFRRFWQSLTPMQQLERTQGRMDVVLKGLVKKFLNEKEVTSTLVMDAMYCGCKLLEEAGHAFLLAAQQAQQHPWGGVLIDSQRGMFFFAGEALAVLERVVEEVVPPFTPDPKADTTVLRHAQESDDYTRDSMERDERRLCDLGRRTVEIFAASYVASNLMEVAWREDDVLRRQDELIKEEERAERAEQLRRAAKAEAEKEKRARKKEKQKQKKEAERARREAEEAERAQREEERRAEQERRNREAEDRRRALEEQREEDRSRAKQAQQHEQQARRKAASSVKAVRQQQAREEKAASSLQPLQQPVQWGAAAGSAEQLCQPGSSAGEQQGAWHGAGAAAEHNGEQASSSYAALASPAGSGAPPPDFEDSEGLASMANGGSRWGEGGEEGEGEREGPSQAWQYSTAASSTGCSTMQNSVATSRAATPEGPYGLRPQQHPSAGTSARTAGSTLSTVSGSDVSAEDEAESLRGQVRWLQDALSLKEGTIRELQERIAELELQLQLADPSGSASQPGAAGPGARQPSTASSAGKWGEGHGGAQGAEASNGVHPPRPAPAENGYPSAAAAHPGAAKAVVAQRQGSGPSATAGSATQRAGQAQRPQAPSEATASGQQLAAHSGAGVALPPSAAILASASLQHAQQGPQQAQQGSSRAMPRQQSAPLLGRARQGNPGPAVQPQPQAVPGQGRARGKGGAAGAAAAPAAAAPVGTSQVPQFSPALPAGAGAQRPAQQPFTGRGGVAVVKAPTPARAVAAGPCTGGGIFGPAPVGVLPAQQQHLPGGAVTPPRGLVPAGGVRPPPPPPPPPLGVSAQQQDGGLFHGRLPPQTNSPYSSPAPPAKGLHHPPAAADSPGLDDFAHMGLITDLLD